MSNNTNTATTAIRNYCLLAATVILVTMGLTDTFNNPYRVAQQEKLDHYGQYVGVGLVAFSQKALR
ncbi:MAG: hypothetical protein AB4041_19740 [Microcystaceae cyanobacterium]